MYFTAPIVFTAEIGLANTAKIKTHIAAEFTYFEDANAVFKQKVSRKGMFYYAYLQFIQLFEKAHFSRHHVIVHFCLGRHRLFQLFRLREEGGCLLQDLEDSLGPCRCHVSRGSTVRI